MDYVDVMVDPTPIQAMKFTLDRAVTEGARIVRQQDRARPTRWRPSSLAARRASVFF